MATKSIVATKVGMTQVWDEDNRIVPVTVLRVQPCRVVQIKTPERDGYSALQVTYGQRDARKLTMPKAGHFAAAGVDPGEKLVELRLDDVSEYEVGQEIGADVFAAGDLVDVTGVSQGQGLRRHHEAPRLRRSARQPRRPPGAPQARRHRRLRHAGPRVQGPAHGRPHGQRAGDHQNLTVVQADPEREIVLIRGSVPGPKQSTVLIKNATKKAVTS